MNKFEMTLTNEVYKKGGDMYILAKGTLGEVEKTYFYVAKPCGTGIATDYCIAEKNWKNEWRPTNRKEKDGVGCSITPKVVNKPEDFKEKAIAIAQNYAKMKHQKKVEESKAIIEIFKEILDTTKPMTWNRKIYGRQGNYSIYSNNEKYEITDEQASKLKKYEDRTINTVADDWEKIDSLNLIEE